MGEGVNAEGNVGLVMRQTEMRDDAFLGGRLTIRQPRRGFRSGSDAVLLAAAVPAQAGERVLDVGCGAGTAGLCLASRVCGIRLSGLELIGEMAVLAEENARRNGIEADIHQGDVKVPPIALRTARFDHVISNPPFFALGRNRPSPDPLRAAARTEVSANLAQWLDFCIRALKPSGRLTLIHRYERLDEIRAILAAHNLGGVVLPLTARSGEMPRRVIVSARSGGGALVQVGAFVLHDGTDGAYRPEADAILRHGAAIDLDHMAEG